MLILKYLSMEPIDYWIRVAPNYNYVLLTGETPHQLLWQLSRYLEAFVDLSWFTMHFFPQKYRNSHPEIQKSEGFPSLLTCQQEVVGSSVSERTNHGPSPMGLTTAGSTVHGTVVVVCSWVSIF